MKKLTVPMTQQETTQGWIYFAFQMTALQLLLSAINFFLGGLLSESGLNVVYFVLNFSCNIAIFHNFLKESTKVAFRKPGQCLSSAALGFGLYWLSSIIIGRLILLLYPDFSNINDDSVLRMLRADPVLMSVGVVLLVPLAEELVFRGLIFRPLYNRHPWLGYGVSAISFALLHIIGYIGTHDPVVLLLCFIQYLPAGLSIAWAYARSQTIWASVLIHTAVNLISVLVMR